MIITLSGWLLEYPYIYFLGDAINSTHQMLDNCLSMIPLTLYQLKLPQLFSSNRLGQATIKGTTEDGYSTILSFSAPQSVIEETSGNGLECLELTIRQRLRQLERVDQNIWQEPGLRVSVQHVKLPHVLL